MPESQPAAPSDTAERAPLTSDREINHHLNALLGFPSNEDTNESVEATAEPEAGESAESEVEPEEVEAEASAEAATETEESADADVEPAEESPPPRKLRIPKEDGTHEEVDEEEAVKGYMRREDYTKKRMAEAEREKQRESEFEAVRAEREKYATYLQQLEEALKPPTPDWDKIRQESPEEFPALFAQHQLQVEQHKVAQAERERAERQVQQDRMAQLAKVLDTERTKLYEKVPELKEEPTAKALGEYLKGQGFTEQEIAGTSRHELLVLAHKARLYDEMKANKPKIQEKVEQKIKPAKPGVPNSTKPKVTQFERDVAQLKRTGDERALAKVLNKLFE